MPRRAVFTDNKHSDDRRRQRLSYLRHRDKRLAKASLRSRSTPTARVKKAERELSDAHLDMVALMQLESGMFSQYEPIYIKQTGPDPQDWQI